ncbi:MAG: DUF2207 domain-containing protein [Candidatus Dojkabacteria bacterium]|nr:DUF2207 domain-containing protein [Candidatus Dojkabacteria bacterium]
MNKLIKNLSISLLFFIISAFVLSVNNKSSAQVTINFPEYEVDIEIQKDTSLIIREEITNEVTGNFHGLRRDIPLSNNQCEGNLELTCGGFESIIPLGIYNQFGDKPEDGTTRFYFYIDDYGQEFARLEWELYPEGKEVNYEEYKWIVEYEILGSIVAGGEDNTPLFYWNTLPADSFGTFDNTKITIEFPKSVDLDYEKFDFLSPVGFEYRINRSRQYN